MITVTITKEQLEAADACGDGLDLYEACCCEVGHVQIKDWQHVHSVWLATAYPSFSDWLVSNGIIPRANLARANLGGAHPDGAYPAPPHPAPADLGRTRPPPPEPGG